MSSSTQSGYADLRETKRRLNIPDTVDSSDNKIADNMNDADNYINTQIQIHAVTPITNPDTELVSLASSYAATMFNYWQTPVKDRNLEGMNKWEKKIQDHIVAMYGKYNPGGLGGNELFGKTTGFKP
jgi:hypothetical protein